MTETEAVAEPVEAFHITEEAVEIAASDLGTSPKGIHTRATRLGWEVTVRRSRTHHEDVPFLNDGKTGQRGEVKTAAHERRHYSLVAIDSTRKVGFSAMWTGKGADGKTAAFIDAIVVDPVGMPVELYVDYDLGSVITKARGCGEAKAREFVETCDRDYNDGKSYLCKRFMLKSAADLVDWLNDWTEMAGLEVIVPKPKKVKTPEPEPTGLELIALGEWTAE